MKLKRVGNEAVLKPRKGVPWEKDAVFNAAAIFADGKFHLFYRGARDTPRHDRSCIGHAWSSDGVHFERADEPILRNGTRPDNTAGVQDPRIVKLDDTYYLTYVCWNEREVELGLATSRDLISWQDHGVIFGQGLFGNNKNGTLWPEKLGGQYAFIHRPMGFRWGEEAHPLDMWLSLSDDLKTWTGHRRLLRARRGEVDWEYLKIGLGAPPFRTDAGWLLVYHAVDKAMVYRLGLALLDLHDPTKVLKQTDQPILEPETKWERNGDVNNVVFTCGAVLRGAELWVYYGAADTTIGLAKGDIREFLT